MSEEISDDGSWTSRIYFLVTGQLPLGRNMGLRAEPTSQSLEKKLLIAGFEVPDVLAIFLLLSILNFVFGGTGYKFAFVWAPTIAAAVTLRIGKRGKPDNYPVHLTKFLVRPKYLSAFKDPQITNPPPKTKRPLR